ncbi:MAG: hypothetical protein LC808_32815 [Actinobacteria bacterium]|nr:hypothetical protein [Actinomycetota bacterium]
MTEKPQDQDRLDRDSERSKEAHWRAAEAGAEVEETQTTPKGLEIPVPKRKDVEGDLRKLVQPEKKP